MTANSSALFVALLAFSTAARTQERGDATIEDGTTVTWAGTIDAVETQSRSLLLRLDDGTRKLLYEPTLEIVEHGSELDLEVGLDRLEKGTLVQVEAVRRGFDFVATRITIDPPPPPEVTRQDENQTVH